MGEYAEGLIDGSFDYITGEYLGSGLGYPRTHSGKRHSNSKSSIQRWLNKQGIKPQEHYPLCEDYIRSCGNLNSVGWKRVVDSIRSRPWSKFKEYIEYRIT